MVAHIHTHTHRALTPAMMQWAAKTGRFVFHKDTSLSVGRMLEKLRAIQMVPGTPMKYEFCPFPLDRIASIICDYTLNRILHFK